MKTKTKPLLSLRWTLSFWPIIRMVLCLLGIAISLAGGAIAGGWSGFFAVWFGLAMGREMPRAQAALEVWLLRQRVALLIPVHIGTNDGTVPFCTAFYGDDDGRGLRTWNPESGEPRPGVWCRRCIGVWEKMHGRKYDGPGRSE